MEKLIELLNEYEKIKEKSEGVDIDTGLLREWGVKKRGFCNYDNIDRWEGDDYVGGVAIAYMIFKQYGFIKWLVENDKIDLLQLDNRIALSEFNKVERVLMALSISDTPIDFLCEILK